jgi:ABC-type bacteriocin/lantibiotic exporter with double-glycine peptidase domain
VLAVLDCVGLKQHFEMIGEGLQCWIEDGELSGGQRQALKLALILLRRPVLIFLDEPSTWLDRVALNALERTIRRSWAGCTIIRITHDVHAIGHDDDVIVLGDNTVVAAGTVRQLLEQGCPQFIELWQPSEDGE